MGIQPYFFFFFFPFSRGVRIERFLALGDEPGQLQFVGPFWISAWTIWHCGETNKTVIPWVEYPPFVRSAVASAMSVLDDAEDRKTALSILAEALQVEEDEEVRSAIAHSIAELASQISPSILTLKVDRLDPHELGETLKGYLSAHPEQISLVNLKPSSDLDISPKDMEELMMQASAFLKDEQIFLSQVISECVQVLTKRAAEHSLPAERRAACESLGKLGDERAIESLLQRLGDSDRQVRYAACEALAKIGGDSLTDTLIQRLQDENPIVRQSAVTALGMIGSERALQALSQLASEAEDEGLRWYAERTLQQATRQEQETQSDIPKFDLGWVPERIERSANHHEWAQSLREAIVQGELDALPTAPLDEVEQLLASWRVGDYEAVARETPAVFRRLVELGDKELLYTLWLLYASHWAGVFDEAMAQGNPLLAVRSCVAGVRICNALGDKACAEFFARRRRELEETYGVQA